MVATTGFDNGNTILVKIPSSDAPSSALVPDTHFIVAGYDKTESGKQQLLYKVRVKEKSIDQINTDSQGAFWDGETYNPYTVNTECCNQDYR